MRWARLEPSPLRPSALEVGLARLSTPPPADRHPVAVYLASLARGSRRTMKQALNVIANLIYVRRPIAIAQNGASRSDKTPDADHTKRRIAIS
jgi:hypothetical protein